MSRLRAEEDFGKVLEWLKRKTDEIEKAVEEILSAVTKQRMAIEELREFVKIVEAGEDSDKDG